MSSPLHERSAIRAALPSWYIDITDEHPVLVSSRVQVPLVTGVLDVRFNHRPFQVAAALLLTVLTYPVALLLSAATPVARASRSAALLAVRVLALAPPPRRPSAICVATSTERVQASVAAVGWSVGSVIDGIDGAARALGAACPAPRPPISGAGTE